MFDIRVALTILAVALPGVILMVPRSLRELEGFVAERVPEGKKIPPRPVLIVLQILQSLVLVGGLALIGEAVGSRVGLEAPFFEALATEGPVADSLPRPLPVLAISAGGSALFLAAYYGLLRRWIGPQTARAMDGLRMRLGIGLRVLHGGIVEEVLARWGLMSLFAWALSFVLPPNVAIWTGIVLAGILFALGHLPSYLAAGCERSVALVATQIILNLWASLIFGYLFWQYGLLAAIISHALFHLIWFPVDVAVDRSEGITRAQALSPQANAG